MRARVRLVLAFILLAAHAAAAQGLPAATVTVRGTPAQPGSILEITVRAAEGLHDPRGTALGQPLTFAAAGERTWRALVGVDVAQQPGPASYEVQFSQAGGPAATTTGTIAIEPRSFPTRRLRVAPQFVDPPPAVTERIVREAAQLNDIFTTVTIPAIFGPFAAPLPGVPGSNFGTRSVFNGEPRAPHAGVDFRGAVGTRIAAPGAGRVVLAEPLFFTGDTVIIDHGLGVYSLLAHLSRIDVAVGQTVALGETVGRLGATGRVTGPHLHWTVRLGATRVDPMRLLALLATAQPGAAVRHSGPAGR
jgi:murein DD-endopeptidase MepM/ murein hydrolase activator NlpD